MSRLLDRLNGSNSTGRAFQRLWQRNCEAVESQFDEVFRALSNMPDIPNELILTDYCGLQKSGQLPRYVQAQRFTGATDNTADATWAFTKDADGLVASISGGLLEITDIAVDTNVTITSTYDDIDVSRTFAVLKSPDAPPVGAITANTFTTLNSTSFVPITDELQIVVGAGGTNTLGGFLRYYADAAAPTGNTLLYTQWYYWDGAAWSAAVTANSVNVNVSAVGTGYRSMANVEAVPVQTHTLRTPGTTDRYKLYAQIATGNVRDIHFAGVVAVTTA
jgi:hypothetical protein